MKKLNKNGLHHGPVRHASLSSSLVPAFSAKLGPNLWESLILTTSDKLFSKSTEGTGTKKLKRVWSKGGVCIKSSCNRMKFRDKFTGSLAREENNLKLTVVLIFYLWVSILKLRMVITQKCSKSGIFNPKRTLFQRSDLIFPLTANGK